MASMCKTHEVGVHGWKRIATSQKQTDGQYRSVYHASRKLNNVGKRYSQFEREALGVKCACQRFYLFLRGNDFEMSRKWSMYFVATYNPHYLNLLEAYPKFCLHLSGKLFRLNN